MQQSQKNHKVSGYLRVVFVEENIKMSQVHLNVNWIYLGDYFAIYTNIKSLCFTTETNIMLCLLYLNKNYF